MESYFWLSRTTVGGAYVLSLSIHWLLRALSLVEERRYPKTGRKWCRFSTATVFAASVGDACRQLKLSIGPRTFRSPSVTVQFRENHEREFCQYERWTIMGKRSRLSKLPPRDESRRVGLESNHYWDSYLSRLRLVRPDRNTDCRSSASEKADFRRVIALR